ncbi:MAG: ribonuclease PH [Gemmatimonadetes bacterium]|nr:ribonuclease PH [Gemmatimonadota bacterium]
MKTLTKRIDGRKIDALRPTKFKRNYLRKVEGAVLVETGHTKVLCTATVEDRVPHFRRDSGGGWLTAEYSMLPRSSSQRIQRETRGVKGRTQEIQRLIGRSLRSVCDLDKVGPRTLTIDCDVIQADGGTRTASITGAYVALHDALTTLKKQGVLGEWPLSDWLAAVSVGVVDGEPMLDLCYEEDFAAEVDMNIVMTGKGKYVEVQGTAEGDPFSSAALTKLLKLGKTGIEDLIAAQKKSLGVKE